MQYFVIVFTFMIAICPDAMAMGSSDDLFGPPGKGSLEPRLDLDLQTQIKFWETINHSLIPFEQRLAAERELLKARDVRMLEVVFAGLLEPVEVIHLPDFDTGTPFRVERFPVAHGLRPASIKPEWDADAPVSMQIAHARSRIWSSLAARAEPEEERHRIYEQLFEEAELLLEKRAEKDWLIHKIMNKASRNWTPKVREHVLNLYLDQDYSTQVRYSAALTLLNMDHATSAVERRAMREKLIATAWAERGSGLAFSMGQLLDTQRNMGDPRVSLLKFDWYERELERARNAGRDPMLGQVDRLDRYFGNVSGLYRNPRAALTGEELEQRDKRIALRQQARETGDDTKLREFEAELAAQRQAELEQRIELIDAWIAENRDRLEAEAEAYAEERTNRGVGRAQD